MSKGPEVFDDSADSTYEWFCVLERFKMSRDIILFTTVSLFICWYMTTSNFTKCLNQNRLNWVHLITSFNLYAIIKVCVALHGS